MATLHEEQPIRHPALPGSTSDALPRLLPQGLTLSGAVILGGILAVGAGLRFAALGHNSVWVDEAFVVKVTEFPWRQVPSLLRLTDAHPPLYYLLMKAWVSVAGAGEAAIRLPSAAFSLLSVFLTYLLMRRSAPAPHSLVAALLVSLSALQIMAGQEARMYALLGTLTLASTLALAVCVERGGTLRWAVYVILAAAMVYTHYMGFLVLAAHGCWVAGYERKQLRTWLVGMGIGAVLFAPWIPSFWSQTIQGHGWIWYRNGVTYLQLVQLMGLFAFGGSLFGMPSYFFSPTPLGTVEQCIVLLPFLLLLWRGVVAFAPDRRNLALVGLPLAITIGVMYTLSLLKPVFYARWFSFLFPFYAMLLARGIFAVADSFRGQRAQILAAITGGLLLYNVAVLDRYYLDEGFRPYRWRDAAALVAGQMRPGDFVLYTSSGAEIAFTYYFNAPIPSLTLRPRPDRPPIGLSALEARRLAARHPRVWVIATPPFAEDEQQRLYTALTGAFQIVSSHDYVATWVDLLEARPR